MNVVTTGSMITVAKGTELSNVAVGRVIVIGGGVGVGGEQSRTTMPSMRQPWIPTLVSLAMRQRSLTFCPAAAAGRFTVVVINPPELPLHAIRPAMGLPNAVEIV